MEKILFSADQHANRLEERFSNLYDTDRRNLLNTFVSSHIQVDKPDIQKLYTESTDLYKLNERQITARHDQVRKAILNNSRRAKNRYAFSGVRDYYSNARVGEVNNIHHLTSESLEFLVSCSISPEYLVEQYRLIQKNMPTSDQSAATPGPLYLATNYDRYVICAADMAVFTSLVDQNVLRSRIKGYKKSQLINDAAQLHNDLIHMGDSLYDFCQAHAEQVGLKPDAIQTKNPNLLNRLMSLPDF